MDIEAVLTRMNGMGTTGDSFESANSLLDALVKDARPGDVILIMSNGSFSGLHQNLLTALSANNK